MNVNVKFGSEEQMKFKKANIYVPIERIHRCMNVCSSVVCCVL